MSPQSSDIPKVLITGFPTMGGSGLVATRLGIELAKRGNIDVHFLFYKRPFFIEDGDDLSNICFHYIQQSNYALFKDIGSPFTIQSASTMANIVKKEGIDIINSHYVIPHAVSSYLASQINPVKLVQSTHGSDTHTLGKQDVHNPVISLALQNSDKVTSVSKYLARESEMVFDLAPESVQVIYDFINTDLFSPQDGSKELSIIQASNFRPVKRIPLIVKIFGQVAKEFPEWKLKLVGDGPDRPRAQRLARSLDICDQVEFLGVQRNIPELFANSSILFSCSETESFGLTIAEAMSCETPVFAPAVGGIPEVCKNNETGVLFDRNTTDSNIDDAVSKLRIFMDDGIKRRTMGKNARKRVLDKFNVETIVTQYEELFHNLKHS